MAGGSVTKIDARVSLGLIAVLLVACTGESPSATPTGSSSPSDNSGATPAASVPAHEAARVAELEFDGDIYDVPDPLPAGELGELIRIQAAADAPNHRLYRMLYHSQGVDGTDLAVTGTLWVPESTPPTDGYPIVALGVGTHNHFSDACPYSNFDAGNPPEYLDLIEELLAEGYVVAYPDYQGLGTRFPYPYSVGASMTRALLDGARAARDLLGPDASDRVFLVGHSVGGYGVLAATKFGPTYDDGLDVRGVVSIDGSVDHYVAVASGMAEPGPSLLLFGILGYTRAFAELQLADVLTADAIEDLAFFDTTPCNTDPPWETASTSEVIHTSPLERDDWVARIEEGTPRAPSYPVFYPVADAEPGLEDRLVMAQRVGAEVAHYAAPVDHYSIIFRAAPDLLAWMESRR